MSSALVLFSDLQDSKSTLFQDELSLQPLPGFPNLVIPKHTSVATHRAHPRQNTVGATACCPRIFHNPMSHPAFKPSSSWGSQLLVKLQSPLHNRKCSDKKKMPSDINNNPALPWHPCRTLAIGLTIILYWWQFVVSLISIKEIPVVGGAFSVPIRLWCGATKSVLTFLMQDGLWQYSSEEWTLFSEFKSGHAGRCQERLSEIRIYLESLKCCFAKVEGAGKGRGDFEGKKKRYLLVRRGKERWGKK